MSATRQQILTQARSYLGVRFRHEGRSREQGLDCFGLVIRVAWDLQLSDFSFSGYGHQPNPQTVVAHCERQMTRIYEPKPADVVLMAYGAWPCHLAFLGDKAQPFSLIHAYAGARKVTETSLAGDFATGIRGYFRLPGVEGA